MGALRVYRDAAGRLTLDLEEVELGERAGEEAKRLLMERLGAAFGERWEDPLGDSATVAFSCRGFRFELDWDHWLGLRVNCLEAEGEAELMRITERFSSMPRVRR